MTRLLTAAVRVVLLLLFAGTLTVQFACPSLAAAFATGAAVSALAVLIVVAGVFVEAVLLSAWMLVGLVPGDHIFDDRRHADRWVNLAIGALVASAAVAALSSAYFLLASPSTVGLALASLAACGVTIALALLVVVMRRLLHTATTLQSELAEVI